MESRINEHVSSSQLCIWESSLWLCREPLLLPPFLPPSVPIQPSHPLADVPVCSSAEPVVYGVGKGEMVDVFCDVVSNPQSYNFEARLVKHQITKASSMQ